MKGIHRAAGAALIAAALGACGAEPIGPDAPGSRPSLLIIGTSASVTTGATSISVTATCAPGDTVSGNSTYIVAYGTPCAIPAPDTAQAAPAPPPDSLQFKLTSR